MKRIKLSEFIDSCGDGIHGTPVYCNAGDYYFINGNNLNGRTISINNQTPRIDKRQFSLIKRPLSERTILLSINGTLGKTAFYNNEKIALGKSICYINIKPEYDKFFFRYILVTKEFKKYMSRVSHGSTIKNFAPSQVGEFEIELPDFKYHSRIADMLNGIDSKISTNSKIMETSEKLMREIYDYWFVQFDFPNENGRPYKSSGGEMVYDKKLKREIPKGWKVLELGDIIKEAKKSSVQVNDARGRTGVYPFFTSGDEILDFDEYYVDGFNIFLNTGGNADIKSYYGKSTYSTDTWCISADEYSYMLFIFLDSIKEQINNNCFAGSGLKHLQKNAFKKIKIVAPEDNLLKAFNDLAQSSHQAVSSYKAENKKLASLRDWLLPMLMNGQVKVQ